MKKIILFSIVVSFLTYIALVQESSAAEEKVSKKPKTCKDFLAGLTKKQMKGIARCTKKLGYKTGKEKSEKMNCILKCVMMDEGLLSSEGYFVRDQVVKFIMREGPEGEEERIIDLMAGCVDYAKAIDPNEEYCKTYNSMIKCFMTLLPKICPSKAP